MTVARMAPVAPPHSAAVQAVLDRVMPPGMPPLTLFTTLARDERLFQKFFAGSLLDGGRLTPREREIVIDRVTARCGSEYEWGVHVALFASRVGLAPEQIASLAQGGADDPGWTDAERALIATCDALHERCTLGEAQWARLRGHFSEEAVLEVLMLAGFYRTVSYLTNALALPLEPIGARFPGAAGGQVGSAA
jgi:alkylhydroperoxidase family enzyme